MHIKKDLDTLKVWKFNHAKMWFVLKTSGSKLDIGHVGAIWSKPGEHGDGIISLHQPQYLHQVPNRPVGLPAGDPLQHGFKGAFTVSH